MRRAVRMLSGMLFATAISGLSWSCAGDQPSTTETVAADDKAPKVPDVPGGSGEGQEKAAGTGSAGAETAPATAPAAADRTPGTKGKGAKGGGTATNWKAGEATIDAELVNIRSTGAMTGSVVKKMKKGEKVTIKECKAGWCEIGEGQFVAGKMLKQ